MADNAARSLLELIDEWGTRRDGAGRSPAVSRQRGDGDSNSAKLWDNQLRATRHLLEIEDFISSQTDAQDYAAALQSLRVFIFAPEARWNTDGAALNPIARSALSVLALVMDRKITDQLHLTPEQLTSMRGAVEDCLFILDAETVRRDKGMKYLHEVLTRLLLALNGEEVDLEKARDDAYAAIGISFTHLESIPEPERHRFIDNLRQFAPFASGAAQGATGNLLSEGATTILGLLPGA